MPPSPVASCARAIQAAAARSAASSDGRACGRFNRTAATLRSSHAAIDGFQMPEARSRWIAAVAFTSLLREVGDHGADGKARRQARRFDARRLYHERVLRIARDQEVGKRFAG